MPDMSIPTILGRAVVDLDSRANYLSSQLLLKESSFRSHRGSSTSCVQFCSVCVLRVSVVNYFASSNIA